ncbi:rod shape-determining protein [Maledivibacter halophilus]|uniref:Cell shape-determining protein MreB n=1 Tax=Maledivibacter halophilus TaxID=36842 RepID=A0A1T5JXQ3_9FIRM|nr:rod shape-determining protein [Maledivibacter halophilus]SKC56140.1 rod shape-determining protein MreB [Maledivibacter halophilus]
MFGTEIGIDLGTASVLVYIKGKGIVLQEPSVVAIDRNTDEILAVGSEARQMLGRTPGNIVAIRPLKDGVISDYEVTERMLRYFINKTCGRKFFIKPKIIVCVPSGVTEVEKRAVIDATTEAGGGKTYLIEEPIAAAVGAGLDITKPDGNMVLDVGGGTSDIAVISLGGIVVSESIKIAGDKFDESIIKYMRKTKNILIGERTAEELKINIGTAFPKTEAIKMDCRGRDLITGLPRTITVTTEDMLEALNETVSVIADAVHSVLEKTPPELASDISTRGIVMTGGGALLNGLNKLIENRTGIPTYIAEDPVSCVATGTGMSLNHLDVLEKSMMTNRRNRRRR